MAQEKFEGDSHTLYLGCSLGYMTEYVCQNSYTKEGIRFTVSMLYLNKPNIYFKKFFFCSFVIEPTAVYNSGPAD